MGLEVASDDAVAQALGRFSYAFVLIFTFAISTLGAEVKVIGRRITVDGVPFHMKGVNWNPIAKGGVHPQGLDFAGFVDQDAQLMAAAGINVVRTYEPLTDTIVLDKLWSHGIYVINTVYSYGSTPTSTAADHVDKVKNHTAILMWAVGNEWNYNGLYVNLGLADATARIREVAQDIKSHDASHPVTTIYGELPDATMLNELSSIDVWGVNAYRGIGFGNLFQQWEALSSKPMYLGEYGADAYDARVNQENQDAQADATRNLTQEIISHSAINTGGVCSGGLLFEFADEWWKDGAGSVTVHDAGGAAPGGGPYPDNTFNEEWWGLVDIDRTPRKAYIAFANVVVPTPPTQPAMLAPALANGSTTTTHQSFGALLSPCQRPSPRLILIVLFSSLLMSAGSMVQVHQIRTTQGELPTDHCMARRSSRKVAVLCTSGRSMHKYCFTD